MESVESGVRKLVRLYSQVLEEESRSVELLLAGQLDAVQASQARSEQYLAMIRASLSELRSRPGSLAAGPAEGQSTRDALRELREMLAEIRELVWRNRRFLQNSLRYTDRMLEAMFGGNSSYDGAAVVHRSEAATSPVRGIRA